MDIQARTMDFQARVNAAEMRNIGHHVIGVESQTDPLQYPPTMPLEIVNTLKEPPAIGIPASLDNILLMRSAKVSVELVENVLQLCRSMAVGTTALTFFKWAGLKLEQQHSRQSWTLIVEVLGNSGNFNEMWDCIKVMKSLNLVNIETFSVVFESYAKADKASEAVKTFNLAEQFGIVKNIDLLNSIVGALSRNSQTSVAAELLNKVKEKISPNMETYALLLEGWEREGNVQMAWLTFGEMIVGIGWDPLNSRSYDALMRTLIKADQGLEAAKILKVLFDKKCVDVSCLSGFLQCFHKRGDIKGAYAVVEFMMQQVMQSGITLDTSTFNIIIGVFCTTGQFDYAYRVLDEMVFFGAFPDFKTYNTIFEALIAAKKVNEASILFREMIKNEFCPLYDNYVSAIRLYFDADDPEMAVTMWKHMLQKEITLKPDAAAALVQGFCDLGRASEARKYCEEAIAKGVQVPLETMTKLKHALLNAGFHGVYEKLEKKLRSLARRTK